MRMPSSTRCCRTSWDAFNATMRKRILLPFLAAVVLLLALRYALEPRRATGLLLARVGTAMGLEISATGVAEYHLRGTPTLVLRDVVAREPGASVPLLRADRIFLSLPWSTLRARGAALAATRLELDGLALDLPALQHWLATRPPSETRLPTLADGLRIRDGSIHNNDWDIDGIQVELPSFVPEAPLHARLRGRYLDPPLTIPVDLGVAIVRPAALVASASTGFAAAGSIVVQRGSDWRLPATMTLSGPLALGGDNLRITPARLGVAAAYEANGSRVPFALGINGPLLFDEAVWLLAPARVVLRGQGEPASDPVPTLDAHGNLALGRRLVLRLQGALAGWPAAWPALPAPLSQSHSPLPFALDYTGTPDLAGIATLQFRRDATEVDARLRLQDMQAWLAADAANPLPPLAATVRAPRLDIGGAQLQGVEIILDDGNLDDGSLDDGSGSPDAAP